MAKGGKGGGKGYQLPGLRQALKAVDALGAQMTGEADADYAVALSALRAGQAGLSKQTRGLTRDLLRGQLVQSTSLSKLAKTARAQKNVVQEGVGKTTNRYGSALGQSVAQSYAPAKAIASGTAKVITGAAKAGRKTTGVAETVAGIAQAGVQAQGAAAKYSLNQALQQRAIVDNQTLASLTGQLYQTALQYNMQMAMYEKQRADALADARKAEMAETKDTLEFLGQSTPELGSWLDTYTDTHKEGEGAVYTDGKLDITKVRDAYMAEMGIDPATLAPGSQDATRVDLITAIAREMKGGSDIHTATVDAMNTLYSGMAGWEKFAPKTLQSINTGITVEQERMALGNLQSVGALTVENQPGLVYDLQGMGNPIDPSGAGGLQYRDAGAAYIRNTYGDATAKAWLRGQTSWSDDAIDTYLSTLDAGVDPTEGFNFTPGT